MSALFPAVVVLAFLAYSATSRVIARRKLARLKISGGRMALVLNLQDRR